MFILKIFKRDVDDLIDGMTCDEDMPQRFGISKSGRWDSCFVGNTEIEFDTNFECNIKTKKWRKTKIILGVIIECKITNNIDTTYSMYCFKGW